MGGKSKGLGLHHFASTYQAELTADSKTTQAFSFIGQGENDYQRWSDGDAINLFFIELNYQEY